jgi:hypothetical protein
MGLWGLGVVVWDLTEQQTFHGAATWEAPPEQARRKHLCVVEDEEIATPQIVCKLCKGCVVDLAAIPVEHEQPRGASLSGRLLRDQLIGKVEVEVGSFQWPSSCTGQHICTTS